MGGAAEGGLAEGKPRSDEFWAGVMAPEPGQVVFGFCGKKTAETRAGMDFSRPERSLSVDLDSWICTSWTGAKSRRRYSALGERDLFLRARQRARPVAMA